MLAQKFSVPLPGCLNFETKETEEVLVLPELYENCTDLDAG